MKNRIILRNLLRQFFSLVLLTSVLASAFSVSAQTRRTAKKSATIAKNSEKTAEKICPNCWSGIVTYTKTLDDKFTSNEPVFGTLNPQSERVTHNNIHQYQYDGRIIVDGTSGQAVTDSRVSFTDYYSEKGSVTELTRCHNFEKDRLITEESNMEKNTEAKGEGAAQNFSISSYGDSFNFGFRFPDAQGKFAQHNTTTRKNFCPGGSQKTPDYDSSDPTKVDGETVSINGYLDPKKPDEIRGSKTWGGERDNGIATFKYTVTWVFRRKPQPLMITNIEFSQPTYPSPNSWGEIGSNDYAIDGNQVKVTATVVNLSGSQKSATVNFKELKENMDLPAGSKTETFAPHEEKEIEYIWDTSGFAWKEANIWNQPQTHREIEVRIPDDVMTKDIQIKPKPVVIIPGLWSKQDALAKLLGFFKNLPTAEWTARVAPVYINRFAVENMQAVEKTVKDIQKQENAWHVDLVAHSTGGLIGRSYVHALMPTQFDGRPTAAHLVMIGTPNMGTPCAAGVDDIFTKIFKRPADSLSELTIKNMKVFNQNVTNRNGTKFAVLVGNAYAPICQMDAPGDGITPNVSAIWNIKTWKFSTVRAPHEEMPGEQANFQQIVNWLAVPPKGDHAPDNSTASNGKFLNNDNVALNDSRSNGVMFLNANFNRSETIKIDDSVIEDDPAPNFSTGVKLAASETKEIEIPVTSGTRLSLILYTSPNVSATLIDDKGEIVGKSLSGTPEAAEIFRTITVKKPFQSGKWKLKLESRDTSETEAAITVFVDYSSSFNSEKSNKNAV